MLPTDGQVKHLHIPCPSKGKPWGRVTLGRSMVGVAQPLHFPLQGCGWRKTQPPWWGLSLLPPQEQKCWLWYRDK